MPIGEGIGFHHLKVNMTILIKLAAWSGKPRASVIFVHGLGGHAYDTWRNKPDDDSFWPLWLAQEVEGLAVYTLGYAAPPSNWLGTAMPLQDRAVNLLECLIGEPQLKDGPVTFVCHSLGGLLVKQIMLDLHQQKARRPEAADLLERITQVVFLATPHTGSRHANWLDRLRFFVRPSAAAKTLVANDPSLRAINKSYRGLAEERRDTLHHRVFYEMHGTAIGLIVDEASADPGLPGVQPVPIDADHIKIAKPSDRNTLQYKRIRDFVAEQPCPLQIPKEYYTYPLPEISFDQPWHIALIQKLLPKSPTQSLPGIEKAVGEAIAAAEKGAAEGEQRMENALKLLQENKLAEAEDLFRAVAMEKEARIRQDSKDVASAYRNLGAIAGLRDPKRAYDAYLKVLEFDGNDMDSLLWAGWFAIDFGLLNNAEQYFRRIIALAKTESQVWFLYWARLGLGDIRIARGDLSIAMDDYREAKGIADRLAQSDPGNAGWQRDLSVSYNKIGDVLVAQGNLPEALKAYRDGLAIRDRLAQSDPGNAGWQRDLAVSYAKLGAIYRKNKDKTKALGMLQQGLAIMVRMTQLSPDNAQWKNDVVWFERQITELKN